MSRSTWASLGVVLLLLVPGFVVGSALLAPSVRGASPPPVTGSITGPTVISQSTSSAYRVYGYGGPAVAANGTVVGKITYYATPVGSNLTGVAFSPATTNITGNKSVVTDLTVGNTTETITIDIMISSTYQGKNESTNISLAVQVVQPFVVSATIVNVSNTTVSAFTVYVTLDGSVIGTVNVTSLTAGASYRLSFKYPTLGLATGDHTFAISLVQEHGLVTFANGQLVYSDTIYVTGPPPDYTLWYVLGIAAFIGALFIIVTRMAARRRGPTRR